MRGSTITFTCSPGFVLTGSNTSICMGNGEWEPDPREVECISADTSTAVYMISSTQRSFEVLCQEGKITVASSMTVFAVSAILFVIGFLCGHFCQKIRKKRKSAETVPPAGGQTQIPYYDDVVLQQELELKEKYNVAYGPI